jgi:hypothetical protein
MAAWLQNTSKAYQRRSRTQLVFPITFCGYHIHAQHFIWIIRRRSRGFTSNVRSIPWYVPNYKILARSTVVRIGFGQYMPSRNTTL